MSSRIELVKGFYGQSDEDGRLERTRHGQLEYRTTMAYIHRYAGKGAKVLWHVADNGRMGAGFLHDEELSKCGTLLERW